MKLPAHFYKPLAIGAPAPLRELPVRPERMIHFFPPHVEKIRAQFRRPREQVDVLCGNLEDAIPAEAKEAARAGFIEVAKNADLGDAGAVDPRQRAEQPVVPRRHDCRSSPRSATSSTSSSSRRSRGPGTSTSWTSCWRSSKQSTASRNRS